MFFVCENFLSTVKKTSCIKNIRFLGGLWEMLRLPNFTDRTKWMVPLDLARLRVL